MNEIASRQIALAELCAGAPVEAGQDNLVAGFQALFPGLQFRHALVRSGWHRIGGVIGRDLAPVASSLRDWAEAECHSDMFCLYAEHGSKGLLTTRHDGKTHYFTAATGPKAADFVQIEVEELVEVVDRPLFVDDRIPDDIEELIDPPGADEARLAPRQLAAPRYAFRDSSEIAPLVARHKASEGSDLRYIRCLDEWDASSAGAAATFCHHFVLRLLPFRDRFGERKVEATPLACGKLPPLDAGAARLSGVPLAGVLQEFDRQAGFNMAWYFYMLVHKKALVDIAQAVYTDARRNYRYLPDRDLKVLESWIRGPYSF